MKKLLWLILLLIPLNVFAYSKYIIPGGETLGIEINSKGVLIVGFYKVNGSYINQEFSIGDKITYIDDVEVNDVDTMVELIDKHMHDSKVNVTYIHEDVEEKTELKLSYFDGTYRTGLYVKGTILGIGTLTYIDPGTNVYGILGHVINESKTKQRVEVRNGFVYDAKVSSFTRSTDGNPGSKNAAINKKVIFGDVIKNTNYGVFGKVNKLYDKDTIEVGKLEEVKNGKAYIYTTDLDNNVKKYEINILEIDVNNKEKNYYFEVVDKELLELSGGIVQGMSGSPIIQDNKIIGAVTRVLIDDVKRGYGIDIVTMLEEGDKLS